MLKHTKPLMTVIAFLGALAAPSGALAFSCAPPATVEADASEADIDRAIVQHLFERLRVDNREWRQRSGEASDQIIVYGRFERTSPTPLPHVAEQAQRLQRWEEEGDDAGSILLGIEYNYVFAFQFDGVQVINGAEVPFTTEKTRITVNVAGEMPSGVTPPTGERVIGRLWEAEGGWYRISSAACGEYDTITPQRYKMLLACLAADTCE